MTCSVIILAAGQGSRMRSKLPKVLHTLAHRSLLEHVWAAANQLNPLRTCIVYGHGGDQVRDHLQDSNIEWAEQAKQLGTGHAVAQAMPHISESGKVLILYGDVPLIKTVTLEAMLEQCSDSEMSLLTIELDNPQGYGRIVRDSEHKVTSIVEHKDATESQLAINEINTGIMCVPAEQLSQWLAKLGNNNAQGEYYLTDIIAMAVSDKIAINTVSATNSHEVEGVNDRLQLARLERYYQAMQAEELMQQGVTLRDPARIDVRGEVTCGQDVIIDINVIIEGKVDIGDGAQIGPNVILKDCTIGAGSIIDANCVIEQAIVGEQCNVGPFARLRPGAKLANKAKVGNFVEIKNADIGEGSKVNHLSYIGDTTMGDNVNVGAGTITCNYDGAYKHRTVIGDNVFIGSNTAMVAPIKLGDGATIGAGSILTTDADADALTLTRTKQKTLSGWKRPVKDK